WWHSRRHFHHRQHRTLEEQCRRAAGTHRVVQRQGLRQTCRGRTEHLHKGSRIFLEGRQRTESWGDKQSGGNKYRTYVYADKIEFLGESQRDGNGQKTELTLEQFYSQEDPTMITDSDVPF